MRDLTPITSRFPSLTSSRSLSSTDCSALGIPETNTALSQCQTPRFQRYEYFDPSLSNEIHLCDDNPNGLQEYLFQLQAQILQLRREKEDLQAQLLEVRNQIEPQNFSADRNDDSDANKSNAVNNKYKTLMSRFAKKFAFGTCLFLPFRAQLKDPISLPEEYDPVTRFISLPGESKEDKSSRLKFGTYWEMFDALPASMKENAKDPRFLKAMVRAMQSFRSHFQYDIRSRPLELLEEFTHLMATNDLKKFSDPEFRASNAWCRMLSGYNETVPDGNPHYPDFPPIICKEVEPGQDPIEGLFRTDIIRKILIIVLFGPGQLRKEQFTRPEICNATHWNITEITPGMIASAAVGARYLVSPDKSFTPVGPQSKIDWQETFHTYKQFLSTRRNDPPIARLFSDFNMELLEYDSGEYAVSGPNNHGMALEQTTASVPDPITDGSQEEVFTSMKVIIKPRIEDAFQIVQRLPHTPAPGGDTDTHLIDIALHSQLQSQTSTTLDDSDCDLALPEPPAPPVEGNTFGFGASMCPSASSTPIIEKVPDVTTDLIPLTRAVDDPRPDSRITGSLNHTTGAFSYASASSSHPSPSAIISSLTVDEIVPAELARVGRILWSMRTAATSDESDKENEPPTKRRKKNPEGGKEEFETSSPVERLALKYK